MSEQTAVLVIAHGSRHQPANDDLRRLTTTLASRGDYEIVEPAFLELAEPGIAKAGDLCVARGASKVLMIPYFLSAGVHLLRDLTAARDELQTRHKTVTFLLGAPLGPDVLLEQLVTARVQQLERQGRPPDIASAATMAERFPSLETH